MFRLIKTKFYQTPKFSLTIQKQDLEVNFLTYFIVQVNTIKPHPAPVFN